LICRNYVAQFLPSHEFYSVVATIKIVTGLFIAKAKEPINIGWKCVFPNSTSKSSNNDSEPIQKIPSLRTGELLKSLMAEVIDKQTSPPKTFNDATLLAAMTGISAHVADPELKKILKETDGLGTEATRAGIIELLFKRGYLRRQGKSIYSTPTGQSLIKALPEVATYPDLTAHWESQLSDINDGLSSYQQLMTPLEEQLNSIVIQSRTVIPYDLKGLGGKPAYRKRKKSTKNKPYRQNNKTKAKFI